MINTFFPICAKETAKLQIVVVFHSAGFGLVTKIVCSSWSTAENCKFVRSVRYASASGDFGLLNEIIAGIFIIFYFFPSTFDFGITPRTGTPNKCSVSSAVLMERSKYSNKNTNPTLTIIPKIPAIAIFVTLF